MTRKRAKHEGGDMYHMKLWIVGILGTLVTGLALGGWTIRDYVANELASKAELTVVQAQATTALDTQMEDIMARIARLETKQKKDQEDWNQIKYLREQLDRLRKMRSIK